METIRMLGVSDTPLSVADVHASVADAATAGGLALFVGAVRNEDGGREVARLSYSAHPTAAAILREVLEKAVGAFPIHAVSAVHRVGDLEIGDIAVVVAVATRGRAEAFEACHRIIDDIKATVPIWKHQFFADGDTEWVGAGNC